MANMGDIHKRVATLRIPIHSCVAAVHKFHQEGDDGWRPSVIRALEEATRDVVLTPDELRQIADEEEANQKDRK